VKKTYCCFAGDSKNDLELAGYQELVTNKAVFLWSVNSLRFAIFSDTLSSMILYPNYALMADPNGHRDSFQSTTPFKFSSATYFIPMTALLGMAIAGTITGRLSDKVGRKPVILACLAGSVFGSIIKWTLRRSFWGFCIANFFNGLMSGSLPVALAYVSDVFTSLRQKSKQFSVIVGFWVLGQSTGGIIGILMESRGLFAPLWAGAAIMVVAFLVNMKFLVEPGKIRVPAEIDGDEEEKDELELPTGVDTQTLVHILIGAFLDIVGSKALFPICMAPFAFETFYNDFIKVGDDPIMSVTSYKWITMMVCLLVLPSAVITPKVFQSFGLAAGAVLGNFVTGVVTIALLFIGNISPPSRASFGGFVAVMYIGFPVTVISQLSTSPMLDRLAPIDQRGYVQGIFTTLLNFGNAFAPWALGLLADTFGITVTLWIGAGFSFAAFFVNSPLLFKKEYKAPKAKKKAPKQHSTLTEEEEKVYIQKASEGVYVPARIISDINMSRIEKGDKYIINHPGCYDRDKENLNKICSEGKEDIKQLHTTIRRLLARYQSNDPALGVMIEANKTCYPPEMEEVHREIGLWFGDYLKDNGYIRPFPMQILKLMIVRSFPPLVRGGNITIDNFEETMLNISRVYYRYLQDELDAESEQRRGLRTLFRRPPRRMAPVG